MKKIIITSRQLRSINESNAINVAATAKDNSVDGFTQAATSTNTANDLANASAAGDVELHVDGPDSSDDQPVQKITVEKGETVQQAMQQQANNDVIAAGGSVIIGGDGLSESRLFTKKSIEEARIASMRKRGVSMSKAQLSEALRNNTL